MIPDQDKKTIEILKDKVNDLVSKLEEALCKYCESEYRSQRAENQRQDYYDIIQKKIDENQQLFEAMEGLNDQIASLTESLSNSKKEIERLSIDNNKISVELKEKNIEIEDIKSKSEKMRKKISEVDTENEKVHQKLNEQYERMEIMQLSLDRYQCKNDKKESVTPNAIGNNSNNTNSNNPQGILKDQSEEILKMQLQIVDLKKRLSEDEKIKTNLLEVIKDKKAKNKVLKNEITKIVSGFEESGKENKWTKELIIQKETINKVLNEKIYALTNENKKLYKKYEKFMNKPPTEDKSVEVNIPLNENNLYQVKASPKLFINN